MAYCGKHVIIVIVAFIGIVRSQECSLKAAEVSLQNRTNQYNQILADGSDEEMVKRLCLTQIRQDENAVSFEDALKLCTNAEVDILQDRWFDLNNNITELCQQDCPNLLRLPECKNMTFLEEIEFSKYERFCQTFRKSYECAKTSMSDCKFGLPLYVKILEPKVMSYWQYICNSGCSNIDETVAVITKCLEPFKKSEVCMAHYTFKECIAQSQNVCKEVLKLVRFIYRKYDIVDKVCTTTTTVTTTALPETTTVFTETHENTEASTAQTTSTITTSFSSTEAPESTKSATEKTETPVKTSAIMTSSSTELPDHGKTVMTSTGAPVSSSNVPIQVEDCLSVQDLEVIEATEINFDSILVFLKLEACLHNTTTDTQRVEVIRATFPASVQQFHARVRAEAWLVAKQSMKDGFNCHKKQEELTDGCSGHEYGLIPCNSGTMLKIDLIKMVTSAILTVFLYMAA